MDKISAAARSRNMAAIRSKDTKPEIAVRRLLHSLGYRYRLHRRDLPGNPDIVFTKRRKVIFVHGCFWHQHAGCKTAHGPKSRMEYWDEKLRKNVKRDLKSRDELEKNGWNVLIVWECEVKNVKNIQDKLINFLEFGALLQK